MGGLHDQNNTLGFSIRARALSSFRAKSARLRYIEADRGYSGFQGKQQQPIDQTRGFAGDHHGRDDRRSAPEMRAGGDKQRRSREEEVRHFTSNLRMALIKEVRAI